MKLATLQRRFHRAITAREGDDDDSGWSAELRPGLRVYRNAYRARLLDCLRATFPRTVALTGEAPFAAAAAHHLIVHPPQGWSLDDAARGFDATLAELFPAEPEVAELAWLEWAMQEAFTGPERAAIDPAAFAALAAGWDDERWSRLVLSPVPTLTVRRTTADCTALWDSSETGFAGPQQTVPATVAVWRQGLRSRFRMVDDVEAAALGMVGEGIAFGALCEAMVKRLGAEHGIAESGRLLGQWIGDGMIALEH